MASGRPSFRPDIEGLRGVAILFVVLFHTGVSALASRTMVPTLGARVASAMTATPRDYLGVTVRTLSDLIAASRHQ